MCPVFGLTSQNRTRAVQSTYTSTSRLTTIRDYARSAVHSLAFRRFVNVIIIVIILTYFYLIHGCNVSCSIVMYKITVGTMIIRLVTSLQRDFIFFFHILRESCTYNIILIYT